jgi:hypothetical protein
MDYAAFQRAAAGFRTGIAYGDDLAVGGGVLGGEDAVPALADDSPVAHDHRSEGAAVPGAHAFSRKLDRAPHEFLFHAKSLTISRLALPRPGNIISFALIFQRGLPSPGKLPMVTHR